MNVSIINPKWITNVYLVLLFSFLIIRIVEINSITYVKYNYNNLFIAEINNFLVYIAIILEIISIGFRSISLGFRIFANISAGHILSDILFILKCINFSNIFSLIINILQPSLILIYESIVSVIQLCVFIFD